MKQVFFTVFFLLTQLFAINSQAGQNPIGWSRIPAAGFPAQSIAGSSYAVSYTITNNLPFPTPLAVYESYTGGTFGVTNGCNKTLAAKGQPNSSCLVHISFQPTAARINTITLTLAYGKNRVPLVLNSTAISPDTIDGLTGHVTSPLPGVTYTGAVYPVGFTFANNGKTVIAASAVRISGFAATSNTCTTALAPDATCIVTGTFTPSTLGAATLGVTYIYGNGSIPLITQTNVNNSNGACHHINGQSALPFPTSTLVYTDNVVRYDFTNYCPSAEKLGVVALAADGGATLTKGQDKCSNITLASQATCSVYVSVVPPVINADLSVTATVPYNSNSVLARSTTSTAVNAIPTPSTTHTVTFVNQCDRNVWYEFANGVGGANSPDPTPANQRTFTDYQIPKQLKGAAPHTKVVTFNEYINGNIYGRTNCNFSTGFCLTANCPIQSANNWSCIPGEGVSGPATLLEEYMPAATNSDGVYDVTVINGLNIPAEIKSLTALSSNTFGCGQAAGAVIQPAGSLLGACSWNFSPPTTGIDSAANFVWVSNGADDNCSSSCGAGTYCGTAYNSVTAVNGGLAPLNRRCGTFLGYWQVGDYVVYPSAGDWGSHNLYNNYSLSMQLMTGPTGLPYGTINGQAVTYADIYTCPVPTSTGSLNTGYNSGDTNVCGCHQWTMTASSTPCLEDNADWESIVYPRIAWIKEACPTAYTYQYDDKSVSFTCQIPAQKTSYQVTYCPAGKSGAPNSA